MPGPGSVACPKPPRGSHRTLRERIRWQRATLFREAVWTRAGGRCERCEVPVIRTKRVHPRRGEVHHTRGRNVAPEDRYNPEAAQLLCLRCHHRQHGWTA